MGFCGDSGTFEELISFEKRPANGVELDTLVLQIG
jgi:hypothetical protein